MTVGTRVTHKRFKHLTGTVVGLNPYGGGGAYVCWQGFWNTQSVLEPISDLRATPVQP